MVVICSMVWWCMFEYSLKVWIKIIVNLVFFGLDGKLRICELLGCRFKVSIFFIVENIDFEWNVREIVIKMFV